MPVAEPLDYLLSTFCDVEALEMLDRLRDRIRAGEVPAERVNAYRAALQDAIATRSLTPGDYKRLTGDNECTTDEEVAARLQEIAVELFGRSPAQA